jgi:hypothetical protein
MEYIFNCLNALFSAGDSTYPLWLFLVRINVLVFLLPVFFLLFILIADLRNKTISVRDMLTAFFITVIAAFFRFVISQPNIFDPGGISYSRMLTGYPGHFIPAQLYAIIYNIFGSDINLAILLNRISGTFTIPVVFFLCLRLCPHAYYFAAVTSVLLACMPLHILLCSSTVLMPSITFIAALSFLCIIKGIFYTEENRTFCEQICYFAGFSGMALISQARLECILFSLPAILFLFFRHADLLLRFLPAMTAWIFFFSGYAIHTLFAESITIPSLNLLDALQILIQDVLASPFLMLPVHFFLLIVLFIKRPLYGISGFAVYFLSSGFSIVNPDSIAIVRVMSNWIIFMVLFSGYVLYLLWRATLVQKVIAVLVSSFFFLHPVFMHRSLTTRYFETVEHDFFKEQISKVPFDASYIVVPDDEIIRRSYQTTYEPLIKYQTIFNASSHTEAKLIGFTEAMERRESIRCRNGRCFFFHGLPCFDTFYYQPFIISQCSLMFKVRLFVFAERSLADNPGIRCALFVGDRWKKCTEEFSNRKFVFYRIE